MMMMMMIVLVHAHLKIRITVLRRDEQRVFPHLSGYVTPKVALLTSADVFCLFFPFHVYSAIGFKLSSSVVKKGSMWKRKSLILRGIIDAHRKTTLFTLLANTYITLYDFYNVSQKEPSLLVSEARNVIRDDGFNET